MVERLLRLSILALLLAAGTPLAHPAAASPLDVMLVMDNSGSMQRNDPQYLARQVAKQLYEQIENSLYLGMVVFDRDARLVLPLGDAGSASGQTRLAAGLEQLNYRGQLTNSPAAVERAIYELKNNGRPQAGKAIVLLSDGIVDTGDRRRDLEKERWLREDLTLECRRGDIRIIGIAFSNRSDYSNIQSVALKTEGAYFRAFTPEAVTRTLKRVRELLTSEVSPAPVQPPAPIVPVATPDRPVEAQPAAAVIAAPITIPAAKPAASPLTSSQFLLLILIACMLVFLLMFTFILLRIRQTVTPAVPTSRPRPAADPMPQAMLVDVKNITGRKTTTLTKRIINIGRGPNNDVSIPRNTVSAFHATIEFREGTFYIEDQRSRNGTRLNGDRIRPYQAMRLKSGDEVFINVFKFIFLQAYQLPSGETVMWPLDNTTAVPSAAAG